MNQRAVIEKRRHQNDPREFAGEFAENIGPYCGAGAANGAREAGPIERATKGIYELTDRVAKLRSVVAERSERLFGAPMIHDASERSPEEPDKPGGELSELGFALSNLDATLSQAEDEVARLTRGI